MPLGGLAIVPPKPIIAPPTPPTPDRAAPTVSLAGVKGKMTLKQFLGGIKIRVLASEPAALEAELLATAKGAKLAAAFNLTLAATSASLAAGERSLVLKPSRGLVGKPKKRFTVRLRVTATDAARNAATATKTIKVAPPKRKKPAKPGR